jgi:hypothetical protein
VGRTRALNRFQTNTKVYGTNIASKSSTQCRNLVLLKLLPDAASTAAHDLCDLQTSTLHTPIVAVQAITMSIGSNTTGHNKEYYPHEEHILIHFKRWDLSWIHIAEEFNSRVDINRRRTPAALESKWRQLKRDFPLLSLTFTAYLANNAVPSLSMVWPSTERSNLADPPLHVCNHS